MKQENYEPVNKNYKILAPIIQKMLKFNPSQRPTFEEIEEDIDIKLYFNKIFQIEEFFD